MVAAKLHLQRTNWPRTHTQHAPAKVSLSGCVHQLVFLPIRPFATRYRCSGCSPGHKYLIDELRALTQSRSRR